MTVKVVVVLPIGKVQPISDVHSSAVPAGANLLASSGNRPSATNGMSFVTPTVPVHVDRDGQAHFYVNGNWVRADGSVVS